MSKFNLSHTTKSYPSLPYEKIKETVLGKSYDLSLVFVGETKARDINRVTRNKDYVPNVLSFPLDSTSGEIFICPSVAKRQAPRHNHTFKKHIIFLYIHGLLHLKGLDHGTKMDSLEQKYFKQFS